MIVMSLISVGIRGIYTLMHSVRSSDARVARVRGARCTMNERGCTEPPVGQPLARPQLLPPLVHRAPSLFRSPWISYSRFPCIAVSKRLCIEPSKPPCIDTSKPPKRRNQPPAHPRTPERRPPSIVRSDMDLTASFLDYPGRFRLVRKIADGGMATVYEAEQLGPAGFTKRTALKVIHTEYAKQGEF